MKTVNWVGAYEIDPAEWRHSTSPTELWSDIAREPNRGRRALGSAYSYSDALHCPDIMVTMGEGFHREAVIGKDLRSKTWVQGEHRVVMYAGAALSLQNACTYLGSRRWALHSLGGSTGQRVAGAVSTGTHGAYFRRGPLADDVLLVHIVDERGHHFIQPTNGAIAEGKVRDFAVTAAGLAGWDPVTLWNNDAVFAAARLSLGGLGIVAGVVLGARFARATRERVSSTLAWKHVRALVESGSALTENPITGEDGDDFAAFEVAILPHPSATEASCIIVTRDETDEATTNELRRKPLGDDVLCSLVDTLLLNKGTRLTLVEKLVRGSRADSDEFWTCRSVMDVGPAAPLPVTSSELIRPVRSMKDAAEFLDLVLDTLAVLADSPPPSGTLFPGFLTARFTRPSKALLARQRDPDAVIVVHVEVYVLNDVLHGDMYRPAPEARILMDALLREMVRKGAALHWGQHIPRDVSGSTDPECVAIADDIVAEWHRVRRAFQPDLELRGRFDNRLLDAARLSVRHE